MKKFLYLIAAIVLVASLAACANPMQQAMEQAMEQDQDVDLDIDSGDGSVSIDAGDGEESINIDTGDGMEWPSDKLPANVPPVPGVKVTGVMNMGKGIMVVFKEFDKSTADAYIETLKNQGWEKTMEVDLDDELVIIFSDSNESLTFNFDKDDNEGSITYTKN